MASARDSSARKEQLGHVSGGYKAVFDRLDQVIAAAGGEVMREVAVSKIERAPAGFTIHTNRGSLPFDKVVFTGPVNVLRQVAPRTLVQVSGGQDVEYLGVLCVVLVTRKPLMPYYVLNIADDRIPFTGVIGMSNVVSTEETAGRHITYVPRYVLSTDPELNAPEDELRAQFLDGIRRLFPGFDFNDLESVHVNRAVKVQPLQVLGYSHLVPKTDTSDPDFFVLNTAQFVNSTLNNNSVVAAVDEFVAQHGASFRAAGAAPAAVPAPLAKAG